jgi:hypothetical protein
MAGKGVDVWQLYRGLHLIAGHTSEGVDAMHPFDGSQGHYGITSEGVPTLP